MRRGPQAPCCQQRIRIFSHPGGQIQQSPPSVFFPSPDLMTIQRVPDRVLKDALHSPSTKHENPARLSPFFALKARPASGLQPQTCHSLSTSFCQFAFISFPCLLLHPPLPLLTPYRSFPSALPQRSPVPLSTQKRQQTSLGISLQSLSPHPHPGLFSLTAFKKSGSEKPAAAQRAQDPGTK